MSQDEINPKDVKEVLGDDEPQDHSWTSIDLYYKGVHVKKSMPFAIKLNTLKDTIDEYLNAGFEPSWNKDTSVAHLSKPKALDATTEGQSDTPVCGIHGVPMVWRTGTYKSTTAYHKAGDPFAFWSCPSKNADGSFCNYKPK